MKRCHKCKEEKAVEEFCFKNKSKQIYNSTCKLCARALSSEHYLNNKETYLTRSKKLRIERSKLNRQFVNEYLETHPCVDCGEKEIIVLEFDHLDRETKINTISEMITAGLSLETLKFEIEKCQVRCANCHRRKTFKQLEYHKKYI